MIWFPLLLTDPSPCLRWLALREIFKYPDDHEEVQELNRMRTSDSMVTEIVSMQAADGSWKAGGSLSTSQGSIPILASSRIQATGFALTRLGYLGFDLRLPAVEKGMEYLFSQQRADGSWPLPAATEPGEDELPPGQEGDLVPLQTALPLRGLAACGAADDPRAERAYEWLLHQRLPDGAWPTGIASGVYRGVGGYRRLAHSRWGCRSNTTAALICLALHPLHRNGAEARRALDLLLGRETHEESSLGFEVARLVGAEPPRGFLTFFARFDLGLILSLCSQVGASIEDERIAGMLEFVKSRQGVYGLWDYAPRPQVSRWVTFDILRSVAKLGVREDWLSQEPRTPYQSYPQQNRRF
jgi:hypothetical protein